MTADHLIDPTRRGVVIWRWAVFLLAGVYVVWQLIFRGDYSAGGGPFRFLTIWALLFSFFCASRMLAISEGRSTRSWATVVSVTVVLNAMVVILYWKLFFEDPMSVNNRPPVWHQEYYLHGLGPLLQWIDALFVFGAFRAFWRPVAGLLAVSGAYILWIEQVISPANAMPRGRVTSGLPYPFLNNMDAGERLVFYAGWLAGAVAILVAFWAAARGIRRLYEAPGAASG